MEDENLDTGFSMKPLYVFVFAVLLCTLALAGFLTFHHTTDDEKILNEIQMSVEHSYIQNSKDAAEFVSYIRDRYKKEVTIDFKYLDDGTCVFYGSAGTKQFNFKTVYNQ